MLKNVKSSKPAKNDQRSLGRGEGGSISDIPLFGISNSIYLTVGTLTGGEAKTIDQIKNANFSYRIKTHFNQTFQQNQKVKMT